MKSNGRIDILNAPNHLTLYDVPQTYTSTYNDAMRGNWQDTILSKTFFSVGNQQILQNGIRAGVYKQSNGKFIISQQSDNELKMIMRAMFLQHSENKLSHVTEQIKELNDHVLNYCVPRIYSEAKGYIKYLHDASTLVVPLAHPTYSATDKTLELKPFF